MIGSTLSNLSTVDEAVCVILQKARDMLLVKLDLESVLYQSTQMTPMVGMLYVDATLHFGLPPSSPPSPSPPQKKIIIKI